jgi:hypothetical protein
VRLRHEKPSLAWALLLLILLFTMTGDIVADSGACGLKTPASDSGGGGAPDTLYGGPGGQNTHGDPDDFDAVPPIIIWIRYLLLNSFGH